MGVDKFSISIPSELAEELRGIAEAEGVTRSAVVQEATAAYVAARRAGSERVLRERRIAAALELFDDVADTWGEDPRSGLDYLAEIRAASESGRESESNDGE